MNSRPILFSGPMVCAILDGTKTQTRRVVKPQPSMVGDMLRWRGFAVTSGDRPGIYCPYGQPGDRLWVRETWARYGGDYPVVMYKSTSDSLIGTAEIGLINDKFYRCRPSQKIKWRPSTNMPRWASRITLEITAVRVERLNDITETDARDEGVSVPDIAAGRMENPYRNWFSILWDTINAKRGHPWASNPWVWVLEFKLLDGRTHDGLPWGTRP